MRRMRFVGMRIVLFALVFAGVIGLLTAGLWNLLLPPILSLPAINFWQALGLLLLSRLLFGGLGGWGRRVRKSRFVRCWNDLSPEDRERFRRAMGPQRPGDSLSA